MHNPLKSTEGAGCTRWCTVVWCLEHQPSMHLQALSTCTNWGLKGLREEEGGGGGSPKTLLLSGQWAASIDLSHSQRSTKAAVLAPHLCVSIGGGSWHQHITWQQGRGPDLG